MKNKLFLLTTLLLIFSIFSCKREDDPKLDNPDVLSENIDSTLNSFYPKPTPSSNFELIYRQNFTGLNGFDINLSWYDPSTIHGIYLHFNNNVGDVLIDSNGFIKSFDSGIRIDSTLSGNWSGLDDGIIALDYVANPGANKGNLAGLGDKYIAFRAVNMSLPHLKYYGWLRLSVSANGREVKLFSIGYQKNPNTSLYTGEL